MPFVRLSDNYDEHPKFQALTDGAFRLWHQVLAYSRRYQTDGCVPFVIVKSRSSFSASRLAELVKAPRGYTAALWAKDESDGSIIIHDYLDWNLSRADEDKRNEASRERTKRWRKGSHGDASQHASHNASLDARVPDRIGVVESTTLSSIQDLERESKGKPSLPRSSGRQKGRIFLHRWQIDALIAILGAHADGFGLDVWLDNLNEKAALLVLPPDSWKWVQAELHAEIRQRGLAVADVPTETTNKRIAGLQKGGEAFLRMAAERKAREIGQ